MRLDVKDIIRYELIGLEAEIIDSRNKSDIGISGKIIDETKNTLTMEDKDRRKRVFKNNIILNIKINEKSIKIDGKLLANRPKDRIKIK